VLLINIGQTVPNFSSFHSIGIPTPLLFDYNELPEGVKSLHQVISNKLPCHFSCSALLTNQHIFFDNRPSKSPDYSTRFSHSFDAFVFDK